MNKFTKYIGFIFFGSLALLGTYFYLKAVIEFVLQNF